MTALAPDHNAMTGALPISAAAAPQRRAALDRTALAPRWAQAAAVLVSILSGSAAALLTRTGAGWVAIPLAVLAIAVVLGVFLPDRIAARWDRLAAAEGAEGAEL